MLFNIVKYPIFEPSFALLKQMVESHSFIRATQLFKKTDHPILHCLLNRLVGVHVSKNRYIFVFGKQEVALVPKERIYEFINLPKQIVDEFILLFD